uniref:Uncharacterized protein n=1 Tax=Proboscia inermis TaxID=420281 RepID=A0A7S0GLF1_9STRA
MQSAVGLMPDMRACTSSSVVDGFGLLVSVKSDECGCGGCCDGLSKLILFRRMRSAYVIYLVASPTPPPSFPPSPPQTAVSLSCISILTQSTKHTIPSNRNRNSEASSNQNTPAMGSE